MVIIFDIEASCEDKKINPNYNMETIEIGAVKIENGKVVDEFQTFIKPEYVESLTAFCTELTGITYDELKDADPFKDGIVRFYHFIYKHSIYSCGEFDRKFLTREIDNKGDLRIHKMAKNAINSSHINLKNLFTNVTGNKMKGMNGMARDLGIELAGTAHRALDDSRNLAKIYLKLESMREEKLRKVFSDDKLADLLSELSKHEKFTLDLYGELVRKEENGSVELMSVVQFLKKWKYVIEKDHSIRDLIYLSDSDIKTLMKYTKF